MDYLAAWMAGGRWYPAGLAVMALLASARMYRLVKRALALPGGRVQPFGCTEVFAVVVPLPTAVLLLHAPVLYGWMLGSPVALGSVGTAVAWGLGISTAVGVLAARTLVRD
ncbi:hypothetical protein [Streptomyces sp. NPDC090036]|uniref:hypothetical protein n=1 Tax=Streptomyces sp. NPDC090036 TaxID=3365926 RepID=UPI0037F968D5